MTYNFNPHRHVKIWLSKDVDCFLNLENRVRLVTMRETNPDDEINFVYDGNLLSPEAFNELNNFCARYKIKGINIREHVFPNLTTCEEERLVDLYLDEINNLNDGGNLAVASDILRWLEPIYKLGTYTDFDVLVNTQHFSENITVDKPFLIRLGSYAVGNYECIFLNNDTIAIVDSQEALSEIQKIQKGIYQSCSKQPLDSNFIQDFVKKFQAQLNSLSPKLASLLQFDPEFRITTILASEYSGKTSREKRKYIIDQTKDNLSFSHQILAAEKISYYNFSESDVIKKAAEIQRETLKEQLGWRGWLFYSKKQYKTIKTLHSIENDAELITKARQQLRMNLLKNITLYTSGPAALAYHLFGKFFYDKKHVDSEISSFSFAKYGLDKAFLSQNSIPFHVSRNELTTIQNSDIGELSDLSWLQEGEKAIALREHKIKAIQANLPENFQRLKDEISNHIEKIKADLAGCFGFYRHKERYAKIEALKNVLEHFSNHSFDVGAFEAAVNNYRTKDVSASIGKSKTRDLIDELALFGQQAKCLMLTDEVERVNFASNMQKNT